MSERTSDKDEIKAHLIARIDEIARMIVPNGQRSGQYWIGACPWRADNNAGSFWINLGGKAPGTFKDASTEEKGDVFKLIARAFGHAAFPETLAWSRDFLGWQKMPADQRRAVVQKVQDNAEHQVERDAQRLEEARRMAKAKWLEAGAVRGTLGAKYLASRGIDLEALPRVPGAIRYTAKAKHIETNTVWPALVTAMTGPDGTMWAIHRIFLAWDGSGKAPVVPVRKIWPSFTGSAIRLWRGDSGLSERDAAKAGLLERLVLCEGVEDGLSVAVADPRLRIWAAGTLGNLRHIKLPDCCDEVIVCADNDWGKPQAQASLDVALAALVAQGRPVRVARSMVGKDMNDALRAVG